MDDLNAYWLAKGTEQLARARAGTLDVALSYKIDVKPTAAVEPIREGICLDLARA